MKLVIGGAYQGKRAYADRSYKVNDGWMDGQSGSLEDLQNCRGIDQFHEWIKRLIFESERTEWKIADSMMPVLRSTEDLSEIEQWAEAFAGWLYQNHPGLVIVSTELGCGIVPMEKKDRIWREAVGRICTELAKYSDEVVRVVCGLGMRLK